MIDSGLVHVVHSSPDANCCVQELEQLLGQKDVTKDKPGQKNIELKRKITELERYLTGSKRVSQ